MKKNGSIVNPVVTGHHFHNHYCKPMCPSRTVRADSGCVPKVNYLICLNKPQSARYLHFIVINFTFL